MSAFVIQILGISSQSELLWHFVRCFCGNLIVRFVAFHRNFCGSVPRARIESPGHGMRGRNNLASTGCFSPTSSLQEGCSPFRHQMGFLSLMANLDWLPFT